MKKQFHIFITALTFYTRIPDYFNIPYTESYLNQSTRYFPLVGWIVGVISFLTFYVSNYLFNIDIAIIISLISGVLTTGAFHEDGFADFFDGFGGGWNTDKILDIMKDSRVGTYGLVSTIFLFSLKFFSLKYLLSESEIKNSQLLIFFIFIVYHSLARSTAIQLSFLIPYSRKDGLSKVKPIAKSFTKINIILSLFFGLIPLVFLCLYKMSSLFLIVPLIFLILYFKNYLLKWIGGYTGDCLGAVEQIAEVSILLSLMLVWKFL